MIKTKSIEVIDDEIDYVMCIFGQVLAITKNRSILRQLDDLVTWEYVVREDSHQWQS